jgi:dienelactone hydrolase
MHVNLATPVEAEVRIPIDRDAVHANLAVPADPRGLVIFAHGSGSSRHSRRNASVAAALRRERFGTLLLDLLTRDEERRDIQTSEYRFDIPRLADRLIAATHWSMSRASLRSLAIGYFGASTGTAAALIAAADLGRTVAAVVSRGGRPDLASTDLERVSAATLLIVGGRDHGVIELNEQSYHALRCEKDLAIVPGATHLFEEPGTLESVCELAASWFAKHLDARDNETRRGNS